MLKRSTSSKKKVKILLQFRLRLPLRLGGSRRYIEKKVYMCECRFFNIDHVGLILQQEILLLKRFLPYDPSFISSKGCFTGMNCREIRKFFSHVDVVILGSELKRTKIVCAP
mgnify:CR=1 FL=1